MSRLACCVLVNPCLISIPFPNLGKCLKATVAWEWLWCQDTSDSALLVQEKQDAETQHCRDALFSPPLLWGVNTGAETEWEDVRNVIVAEVESEQKHQDYHHCFTAVNVSIWERAGVCAADLQKGRLQCYCLHFTPLLIFWLGQWKLFPFPHASKRSCLCLPEPKIFLKLQGNNSK